MLPFQVVRGECWPRAAFASPRRDAATPEVWCGVFNWPRLPPSSCSLPVQVCRPAPSALGLVSQHLPLLPLAACAGSQAGSSSVKPAPGVTGRPLSDAEQAARARLLQAMLDTPWLAEAGGGGGIPTEYSEDSRYAILNDMTAGELRG